MPLNSLCFVLPDDDADDIENPPPRDCRSHYKHSAPANFIRRVARRSLQWFCNRRWHDLLLWCFADDRRRTRNEPSSSRFEDTAGVVDESPDQRLRGGTPHIFSYAELYIGTSGFSPEELLGSGGFGRVYRAVLPSDGTLVAVKRVAESGDDRFLKSFAAELAAVAQLRHRNLVRLRGWCIHEQQILLVYDYMPNRSLDRLLFAPPSAPPLEWDRRRRVVHGLAAALFYLHEQLDTQIIHRDVKASNVMLDSGYNARLGDFGLARWLEHVKLEMPVGSYSGKDYQHQFRLTDTSQIGGTIGYVPPESFQKRGGVATAKSDVFSFGVVILEIATGRRAVDLTYPDDQIFMLDWVRRLSDEGRSLYAGDRRLPDGSYSLSEMGLLIHLGLLCSLHDPQCRPTMKWVLEALSGHYSGDLPALPAFNSHPLYISFSSDSNTTATTTTATTLTAGSSSYLTAAGTTKFLTATNGGGSGGKKSGGNCPTSIPNINTPHEIPYKEILAITENFSESKMVAELDFGTGYHGYLDGGRTHVLVKRLGMKTCPALRTRFADELKNLARLRHRHLVQLRGWCTERGEMLVVYDFSSGRLLSHSLFHRTRSAVLSWSLRYRILKSLASAVLYLHEEWEEQVIHRNITSSAVLLDSEMNPRLGSFALAEFLSRNEQSHHIASSNTTSARGIFGYMSPEYMESGEATTKADVYSFGVVVLEVVSGSMAVDFRRPEVLLVRRVCGSPTAAERQLEGFVDMRLDGKFDGGEMARLVNLGIACTQSDPESRPSMKQIVSILDGNEGMLKMLLEGHKKEGREDWDARNVVALSLVRRIQALGIN